MAVPVFVQEVTSDHYELPASATLTIPVNADTASSNTLVLIVAGRDDSGAISSVTDSRGNEWASDAASSEASSFDFVAIASGFMDDPLLIGDSIVVTFGGVVGSALLVWVEEFSGVFPSVALDQTGAYGAGGDATPTVTASGDTSQVNEVSIVAWVTDDTPATAITQDGTYTTFPGGQLTTIGALPGERTAIAGYRIMGAIATESSTITFPDGITPTAGVIATYKAAADAPSTPSFYGNVYGADSLYNLEWGTSAGRRISIRWRADHTGTINSLSIFRKSGASYSAGTGGAIRIDVRSDDGTASHFPVASPNLATAGPVATPNSSAVQTFTFASALSVVAGTIYHFVITNTDANPVANYCSLDDLGTENATSPILPTIPDNDLALLMQFTGPPWTRNVYHIPVFCCNFADGHFSGNSYYDVSSVSGFRSIQGANNAVRMVFTPSLSFSISKVRPRLGKITGETVALSVLIKNNAGSTLSSGSVLAAAVPVVTPGDPPRGANWVTCNVVQAFVSSSTYRVELWSTAAVDGYRAWPILAGPGGGTFASLQSDNVFSEGYFEYTTDGGANWLRHASSTAWKPQMYFETSSPTAPPGTGHSVRTLTGAGL